MELPPLDIEYFNKWRITNAIIKECDMDAQTKTEAEEHVRTGIERYTGAEGLDILAASKFIKEQMDRQFGPTWHCIIGEGYSFEVTRQQHSTLLMYYGGIYAILLFKC